MQLVDEGSALQGHVFVGSKSVRGRDKAVLGFGNPALKQWGVTLDELVWLTVEATKKFDSSKGILNA